ncbi:ArdC-like ssDNA-binding domain-containing protein [Bacillus cereus]|uniref:ImmA/IrrE family metallo-endopeptidase n=2 Tax=Bacillus cereus TaxID=1396 RepID=A0ABD7DPU2_BACCE|nr:LPD25 domain-containing protein [Bacillus cereus]MCU4935358.1 ArdC-like ssDNA-binding domain-containing protein [Bacillus cereus]MCU5503498.1 ArdC-like ssDNA-binding domain-containing protein [Bacillus cereus]MCU5622992.1 ArdC-like ssDNA-binding domain-containing protein [Bacillus cereus]MCU5678867.1 ArdC-like ssDNA-binding domain-containing protein [Bacillus cereus]MDA2101790.1 ArdC-like ssDNA-binding domain-containing protein [Bacillus cereus]
MSKSYKKKYQTKSPDEKKEAVQALTKKMEKSVEGYFRTPGDLKEYLTFMAKFYHYSPSNISLIQSQFQGASAVGSFSFWKEKGFPVKKGEKGIKILVPNRTVAKFKDKDGTWKSVTKASEQEKKQIESKSVEVKPGRLYFAVGHVFDVSQTNAKAEDLPRIFPNRWLDGSVTDYQSLYKGMEAIAEKNDVKIIAPKSELGVAKGVSYPLTKEVALNPRNSELQNVKTLLHELAHAKLHTAETHMHYTAPEKEFQAEMTAYAVSSYFGIDTSEYSLGYLASWTQGKEMKDKTKLLKEVHETSIEFIETIESSLEKEKTNEKGVDHMAKQVSENKDGNVRDNFEVLTDIQQNAQRLINERLGLNFEKHWENYEIQLSEDNRVLEEINPNIRLNLGEMEQIVYEFGTNREQDTFKKIVDTLEPYYEADLLEDSFNDIPIAKVSLDREKRLKVDCVNEHVKENHKDFWFQNSVSLALNVINHRISTAHKEVMNNEIEYKGLYPKSESEVIYCQETGKPLQHNEEVFHVEGHGYTVAEEASFKGLDQEDGYYTTIEYEQVEEKILAPIGLEKNAQPSFVNEKQNEKNILLVEYMSLSNTTQELVSVAELREQADRNRAFEPVEGAGKLSDKEFIDAFNEANQEKYAALNQDEINRPTMLVQWSDNETFKNNQLIPFGEANEKMAEVITSIEKAREEARERGETIPYDQARYHIVIPKGVDRDFGRMELVSMDRMNMGDGDYKTPYEQVLNEKRYLSDEVKQALRDEVVNHRNNKEITMEKAQESTLESLKEAPTHLVTIEVLAKDMQDEEVARIHMMDGVTKDINYLSVWNQDKTNPEDLYVSLMEKNGERENVYLDNILKPDLYEKVQSSIFDGRGNLSFVIHEKDTNMSLDEIVKDERYGLLVDKGEAQKDYSFNEKEVELYKEMKMEGYAPIASLDQQIQPLKEKEPTTLDKDLSRKFEAYRRSQYEETPDNIDSIVTRVKAEERYYTTKYVSIDNELVSQEHIVKLENQVDEKLGKEGITVNQSTTSKETDFDKKFQPVNGKKTNDKEKEKEIDPGNVDQSKSTKKSGRKKETMEMER